MMQLHSRIQPQQKEAFVARITTDRQRHHALRSSEALFLKEDASQGTAGLLSDLSGFQALFVKSDSPDQLLKTSQGIYPLLPEMKYLETGDIVKVVPQAGTIQTLYRRSSPSNFLLLTERCNSKCVMCSQPPRDVEDGYRAADALKAITLMSRETTSLCLTGGETTLLHEQLIELIHAARTHLPKTHLDVLTNGRLLSYLRYTQTIVAAGHPLLTLCIPLYADIDSLHDFVVQAAGAFDQTMRGLLNCGRVGLQVELRVVLHQQNYCRLPQLAAFIARNLPFVHHVALMGLEMTGYTKSNLNALWIDPIRYQPELEAAVETLDWAGIHVSIYNHQLCLLPESLWPFAHQSISDWKNIYLPECAFCAVKSACGGFFASATLRYSDHIHAISSHPSAELRRETL